MLHRFIFVALAGFWVVMTVLLWRAEYGTRRTLGTPVATGTVVEKVLTAPDVSSLSIYRNGTRLGFCHWSTSIGEALSRLEEENTTPEGMVNRVTGYKVHLEGNLIYGEPVQRIRFDSTLKLDRNRQWCEFSARLSTHLATVEVRSVANEQTVHLTLEDEDLRTERVLRFSELENPEELIGEFGGPIAGALWSSLRVPLTMRSLGELGSALQWEARHTNVEISHATTRAYRLEARFLDRYRGVILLSRVGEILRVELPGGVVLINDQLNGL